MRFWMPLLVWALLAAPVTRGENLLKNGALAMADGGAVPDWTLLPKSTPLSQTTDGLPDGVESALTLTVNDVSKGDGQLLQRLYLPADGSISKLLVSGWFQSSEARVGYIQIKLYDDKKELARKNLIYSGETWEQFREQVDVTGATKIEMIVRWRRYDRYANATLSIADLRLMSLDRQLVVIGDSTVQDYPDGSPKRGWGQMLGGHVSGSVAITNAARGGRSSKTFREHNLWEPALAAKPKLLLIQFGHNDSHEPGRPESTDAATTFRENLRRYVTEGREAGATVVLVTPPPRRVWSRDDRSLSPALQPYAAAVRDVAAEMQAPLVDLYAAGSAHMATLSQDEQVAMYCSHKDRSHYSAAGADWYAAEVARAVAEQLPDFADWFSPTPPAAD